MTAVGAPAAGTGAAPAQTQRWRVLALLCGLQFMILMDITIVNVALPRIQDGLGFSASGLTWVVNAYVLAAGGHGMMWGPGLGFKMAELIATGTVADLPDDEIRLARFAAERTSKDKIALPFPT